MEVISKTSWLAAVILIVMFGCAPARQRSTTGGSTAMNPEMQSQIIGHWIHSHEEDAGDQMIFRHPDHPFPPSRGRSEYRLDAGGVLNATRPGPTDRRESAQGTWSIEEENTLVLHPAGSPPQRFSILSVDPGKLVLRRP
jgi:hypothetical protein